MMSILHGSGIGILPMNHGLAAFARGYGVPRKPVPRYPRGPDRETNRRIKSSIVTIPVRLLF